MNTVVIGDVLLDIDLTGTAERLSPDAPVPVIDIVNTRIRPGGAGLVARMLADDGEDVHLVSAFSDDDRSSQLREALRGIDLHVGPSHGPTPVKTRLRADQHAVARIDEGCADPAVPTITGDMLEAVRSADSIIVADYGRGVAADPRLREAIQARGRDVPIVWDPHPRGPAPVPGAAVATPNLREALALSGLARSRPAGSGPVGSGVAAAAAAGRALRERWGCGAVAVTLGPGGALLSIRDSNSREAAPLVVPAPRLDPADPCGAGDRLAATLVIELGRGTRLEDALEAAVRSASAYIAAGGVDVVGRGRLPVPIGGTGVDAMVVAHRVRAAGGTVVATGGCFELLHAGHAATLAAARRLGDCLIVCLNSDDSVSRLKGSERPIIHAADRVALLLALECVDAVMVFEEDSPEEVLRRLQPDIWVKGGDYTVESLPESRLVAGWGGFTVTVPYHPARSTSLLASALAAVG
ncbi:MAG: D-beta-D-heptose 1-phosphate adenosyltransferase [Cryobacterium sp.]|nr:D-beta-D-heptose 1-phosphate adenosyltransferase [Cryobacterium sp.]